MENVKKTLNLSKFRVEKPENEKKFDNSSKVEPNIPCNNTQPNLESNMDQTYTNTHVHTTYECFIFDKVVRALGVICIVCVREFVFFVVNWPIIGLYYLPIERYPIDFQVYYKTNNNQHKEKMNKKIDSTFLIHFDSFVCRNFHLRFFLLPRIFFFLSHSISNIGHTVFFSSLIFILFLPRRCCVCFFVFVVVGFLATAGAAAFCFVQSSFFSLLNGSIVFLKNSNKEVSNFYGFI